MIPLLALWKGVKEGLGEHILKVVEVVWYSISERLRLCILSEGLCKLLRGSLAGMNCGRDWQLVW